MVLSEVVEDPGGISGLSDVVGVGLSGVGGTARVGLCGLSGGE